MIINLKDVSDKVATNIGSSKEDTYKVVKEVVPALLNEMVKGNKITVSGFGQFCTHAGRYGIDFKTKKHFFDDKGSRPALKFSATAKSKFMK